jgi:hypothetical protein
MKTRREHICWKNKTKPDVKPNGKSICNISQSENSWTRTVMYYVQRKHVSRQTGPGQGVDIFFDVEDGDVADFDK